MSPEIVGDVLFPVHLCTEERGHAESERRTMGLLSSLFLAPSSAMHAAPISGLFEEVPSSPRPKWQQPPLSSSYP